VAGGFFPGREKSGRQRKNQASPLAGIKPAALVRSEKCIIILKSIYTFPYTNTLQLFIIKN
jgi:hypothetical protein